MVLLVDDGHIGQHHSIIRVEEILILLLGRTLASVSSRARTAGSGSSWRPTAPLSTRRRPSALLAIDK
jgi:hypothetical protein